MKIYEIGTGYTSIPAKMGAATEIVVEELTRSMLKLGCDVSILDIKDKHRMQTSLPIQEVYMPQFFSTGAVVKLGLVHKIKRVLYSVSLAMKIKSIIKNIPDDEELFLHFHNQYNLYFFFKMVPRDLRRKCIIGYTVHSHIWFGEWEKIKDKVKINNFQEIYCCQHADRVFVLNKIVSRMLVEHCDVPQAKIIPVINGVNVDTYNEKNSNDVAIKNIKKLYHLENSKIVFQVGSVCERKNQLGTLKLLTPLMKKDKTIAFTYVGGVIDQEYQNSILDYAKSNKLEDRVVYLGEVSPGTQLSNLYTMSDVCFMNSTSEAFALVIAEALSIPRPIFINDAIMRSLVFLGEHEGDGIIRIKDTFENDFNKLFIDKDYYKEMQRKGRNFITNVYSWDVAAKQYIKNMIAL